MPSNLFKEMKNLQVTKSGFSLVWQPTDSSSSASIVKFPFERKCSKDLFVELEVYNCEEFLHCDNKAFELYDKMFLQKKDLVRLLGRVSLDDVSSFVEIFNENKFDCSSCLHQTVNQHTMSPMFLCKPRIMTPSLTLELRSQPGI